MAKVAEIGVAKVWISEKDKIGFRETWFDKTNHPLWPQLARMQVIVVEPHPEIILLDIPAKCLPYLPDEGDGSDFKNKGDWHYYDGVMEIHVDEQKIPLSVVLDGVEIYDGELMRLR